MNSGSPGTKFGLITRVHAVVKQMSPQVLTTQEIADLIGDDITETQVRSAVVTYTGRARKNGKHAIIEYDRSGKMVGWVGLKRGPKPKPPAPPAPANSADQAQAHNDPRNDAGQPLPQPTLPLGDPDDVTLRQYEALSNALRDDPNPRLRAEDIIRTHSRHLAVDDHPAVYENRLGEPTYPDARLHPLGDQSRAASRRAANPTHEKLNHLVNALNQVAESAGDLADEITELQVKALKYDSLKKTLGDL